MKCSVGFEQRLGARIERYEVRRGFVSRATKILILVFIVGVLVFSQVSDNVLSVSPNIVPTLLIKGNK